MKDNSIDISIVLDRSGSMSSIADDTIGGFNTFLQEQKGGDGQAAITLVQFDDVCETVYSALDIQSAPLLSRQTFVPRGSTALLDAIGRTINGTGARLSAMPEPERPATVLFVILTDGEENASSQFGAAQINTMIVHQRDVYGWQFVFLGANQDAITTASRIGIGAAQSLTYAADGDGVQEVFASVSRHTSQSRRLLSPAPIAFEESDRNAQKRSR